MCNDIMSTDFSDNQSVPNYSQLREVSFRVGHTTSLLFHTLPRVSIGFSLHRPLTRRVIVAFSSVAGCSQLGACSIVYRLARRSVICVPHVVHHFPLAPRNLPPLSRPVGGRCATKCLLSHTDPLARAWWLPSLPNDLYLSRGLACGGGVTPK